MKKRIILTGLLFLFILVLGPISLPNASASVSMSSLENENVEIKINQVKSLKFHPERLIVKFKDSKQPIQDLLGSNLATISREFNSGAKLISLPGISNQDLEEIKAELQKSELVEYVENDYKVYPQAFPCNDPLYWKLWGIENRGQIIELIPGIPGIDINAVAAWDITKGDPSMVVAILDTGVDLHHPELINRVWVNPGEIPDNNIDDDNNGYIDDVNGYDFYNNDNTVYDNNTNDVHGTHIAGIIAAKFNNDRGICGVAPNVKIMPLKFIGADGGNVSDAIEAIEYASSMGVKLSNNSWAGAEYSQALKDAIENSEMLFVCSAGNTGDDTDINPQYPASFNCNNIISVAAVNNRGNIPFWSSYGRNSVDVGAPGVGILSILEFVPGSDILYGYISGTSQAAPFVTGTAALVWSEYPELNAWEVKNRILSTVKPLPGLENITVTGGMIDVYNALNID